MHIEQVNLLKQGAKTWNQWREKHPDIQPDLRHADLSEADLHDAILSRTDLRDALLLEANLENADLQYANLCDANLSNSYLGGARFDHAIMGNTTLRSVNLGQVTGLETIQHKSPSYVGMDTIFLSGGKIPISFLNGAGVEASQIEIAKALLQKPFYHTCFISYSHQDKDFAKKLVKKLLLHGIDCWLDDRQLFAGEELSPELQSAIEKRDKLLLCCSKGSLVSKWVALELESAMKKERRYELEGKKVLAVIPLDLDGYLLKDEWNSPFSDKIRERVAANFTKALADPAEFDLQVERLAQALLTEEGRQQQEAALAARL